MRSEKKTEGKNVGLTQATVKKLDDIARSLGSGDLPVEVDAIVELMIEFALARREEFMKSIRCSLHIEGLEMYEPSPSRVFEMFWQGMSPIQVCEKYDYDPKRVRDWFRAWLDMMKDWAKHKFVELEGEARERLEQLKELAGANALKLQGKNPKGSLAGMVYIMAKERGLKISYATLSEVYGVTDLCVSLHVKLLKQVMKDRGVGSEWLTSEDK